MTPPSNAGGEGREVLAWHLLCERLQRDPATSEESDTCSLRAAWKAMLAFSARENADDRAPALVEAAVAEEGA